MPSISEEEKPRVARAMAIVLTYFTPLRFESHTYNATDICAWFEEYLSTTRLRSQAQPFTIANFDSFLDHLKLALAAGDPLQSFVKANMDSL